MYTLIARTGGVQVAASRSHGQVIETQRVWASMEECEGELEEVVVVRRAAASKRRRRRESCRDRSRLGVGLEMYTSELCRGNGC
jgi:hypothetical protein